MYMSMQEMHIDSRWYTFEMIYVTVRTVRGAAHMVGNPI